MKSLLTKIHALGEEILFSPPQLADIFDVNPSTIKRWVDKGYLKATITPGGHRRVSPAQLRAFIDSYPKYAGKSYTIARQSKKAESGKAMDWNEYYLAVYEERYEEALAMVDDAFTAGIAPHLICQDLIAPALINVGYLWEEKLISVYDEHRMSFWIRRQLDHLLTLSGQEGTASKTALLACAPGDSHEIALLMAHIVLANAGWKVVHLGINVPRRSMVKAMKEFEPDVVCLSRQYTERKNVDYLKAIRAALKDGASLVMGGNWNEKEVAYAKRAKQVELVASLAEFDTIIRSYGKKKAT